MGLDATFRKTATTLFNVFKSLSIPVTYTHVADNGIDIPTTLVVPVTAIFTKLSTKDASSLSFANFVQPSDYICLIAGESFLGQNPAIGATITTTTQSNVFAANEVFNVIAFDVDPARAVFTILLRT